MSETVSKVRSASGVSVEDVSSYRSYLVFDARADAVELALQQVEGWLREKGYDEPDLGRSQFAQLNDTSELVVVHHEAKRSHDFRVRLSETDSAGEQWLTSIAMHSPQRGEGWLSVRIGHTGGKPAETPRVARYLMGVLDLRDADFRVVAGAPIIRPDGVDDLLEALCAPERIGLMFVAGTDASGADVFMRFVQRAERWARRVHGIAQFVVLDPAATVAFNAGIGATHAAIPWTIRTYAVGVDPAWEPDARRHRILSTRRLATERDADISGIIVRAARKHSAHHQLPDSARSIMRGLNRVEDRLLLDSLFASTAEAGAENRTAVDEGRSASADALRAPAEPMPTSGPVAPDASEANDPSREEISSAVDAVGDSVAETLSEYLATLEMVKNALGVEQLTPESLERVAEAATSAAAHSSARQGITDRVSKELAERQERIDSLEDGLAEMRIIADDAILEQRLAEDARRRVEDEARWLRRVLNDQGRHDEAWGVIPDAEVTKVPEDFEALLDRLVELEQRGVVFTGDSRTTLSLDDRDTMGNIVASAWECLLVLADYVAAKKAGDHVGNVKSYLLQAPTGYRTVSQTRFGERESESTMNQWGRDRSFAVPEDVDPAGCVLMEAHFKLPRCGMISPRIHYHDHSHASGKVYVGYIGPHLRTKSTN